MKTAWTILLCLAFALAAPVASVGAQGEPGGPPEGKGPPEGGGPPSGEMLDVRGCAYFDEELAIWRLRAPDTEAGYPNCLPEDPGVDGMDWKLDFGPEGYCPDPCLTGEFITDQLDGANPVTIRIGKNLVGTFKLSDDLTTVLAETDPASPARYAQFELEWIPLTPAEGTNYGRPIEGKWVRVWGRAGETSYSVLVWELRYPNTTELPNDYWRWFWWRSTGQPWAKMQLLNCEPVSE